MYNDGWVDCEDVMIVNVSIFWCDIDDSMQNPKFSNLLHDDDITCGANNSGAIGVHCQRKFHYAKII